MRASGPHREADMQINFDGLVEAYIDEHHWRGGAPAVRDYFAHRLRLLEQIFGTSLHRDAERRSGLRRGRERRGAQPDLNAPPRSSSHDRSCVARLARDCLTRSELYAPFGVRFEGGPGEMEAALEARYAAPLRDSIQRLKQQYRDLLRDALALLYPHALDRTSSEQFLEQMGLPEKPDLRWG